MTDLEQVMEMEKRRRTAMVAGDIDALKKMFADDMLWVHATARADTKQELLNSIESGKTRYIELNCSGEAVRFYNSVAVVSGILDMKVETSGELKTVQSRYTILWNRSSEGAWRVVNWQSTTVRK